jgi:hypothetical protein
MTLGRFARAAPGDNFIHATKASLTQAGAGMHPTDATTWRWKRPHMCINIKFRYTTHSTQSFTGSNKLFLKKTIKMYDPDNLFCNAQFSYGMI